jgi:osmotically inducible protein OsmC
MPVRKSEATWLGTLKEGNGTMKLASGLYEGPYTYSSRFEEAAGTNPEELVGAAHAGCFSMFLAALLTDKGYARSGLHHGQRSFGRRPYHQEDRARL